MRAIYSQEFSELCKKHGIQIDPSLCIGFSVGPLRTIVIHFARADFSEHFKKILSVVCSLDNAWVLAPPPGLRPDQRFPFADDKPEAILFEQTEIAILSDLLASHLEKMLRESDDLYLIGGKGTIIASYDHHIFNEGLTLFINDIETAGQLLLKLNTVGAELEVYYNNEPQAHICGLLGET